MARAVSGLPPNMMRTIPVAARRLTAIWFSMAMAFALWLAPMMIGDQWGADHTKLFITGYVVELSLSMDNVFVIALIFAYFRVPLEYQHRILFWGILGVIVLRAIMIGLGAGESPFLMAEQFGLDQRLGDGGTVNANQRRFGALALLVNGPCHKLFARARLP